MREVLGGAGDDPGQNLDRAIRLGCTPNESNQRLRLIHLNDRSSAARPVDAWSEGGGYGANRWSIAGAQEAVKGSRADFLFRILSTRVEPILSGPAPTRVVGSACIDCYGARGREEGLGMEDQAFASTTELAAQIRGRRVGCVELLDFYLARAQRHNPALNAIVVWQVDQARERARAADAALARGERWGPLHGIPMTVKESFNVAGLPTTFGNPLWKDNIAAGNAFLIDRLLQAGAIVFGKTNVPYMLGDAQSYNDIYGTTNNPWDPARSPGGSSGGEAAALAAGLSALGAGSDIAGSLRNPAHYCGIYAHKPTWGLISTRGHAPPGIMTPTDISVVGPMARSAQDLDLALHALAGPDLLQQAAWRVELPAPRHRGLGEFRVAVRASSPLCRIDTSASDLFDQAVAAIARAGAAVDNAARPDIDDEEHQRLFMLLLRAATASRMRDEDFAQQQEIAATLSDDDISDRAAVARGATLLHRAWGAANEARTKLRYAWREFFTRFDVLLTPVAATAAFRHDHNPSRDERTVDVNGKRAPYAEQLFFAGFASLSYLPATVAPIGFTAEGLPVGLQIIGPEGEDPTTIEFARLLGSEIGGFMPPPAFQ
jgi:amidase